MGLGAMACQKKNKKNAMQELAAHRVSPPFGVQGKGGGYHVFTMFSIWTQAGDRNPPA